MKRVKDLIKLVFVILILGVFICIAGEKFIILNPYEEVDWERFGQYKACLHAHSTVSDGRLHPHQVVDAYHSLGYSILSITDHNRITYPWEKFTELTPSFGARKYFPEGIKYENRDPKSLGMLAVIGNELSVHHHMGSYFNDFKEPSDNIEYSIDMIMDKGGIAVLFHPGSYKDYDLTTFELTKNWVKFSSDTSQNNDEWYIKLFKKYPMSILVGLEVYNSGDTYFKDRELWDKLLTVLMPDRPIWGFSNDDSHVAGAIGNNWNVFLLPELTRTELKKSMKKGSFYFGYSPDKPAGIPVMIKKIEVDKEKGIIRIYASNYTKIEWISNGKVIYTGEEIILEKIKDRIGNYVRARIYGKDGISVAKTQPFGIIKQKD